jgi:spermidine/putrescine transport system permease protein
VSATEAASETQAVSGATRGRRGFVTGGLIAAPLGFLLLFFIVPIIMVAAYSVGLLTLLPHDHYLSLEPWRDFLFDSIYLGVFWKSVRISLTVSVISVVLAYPIAYFLALVAGRRKYTLLLVTIAPFLTSYLLRVLAWRVLLNNQGVLQTLLRSTGVLGDHQSIEWLFNSQFAVQLVLAYVWVPFVALPLFVSLESLDLELLEVSSDLGASRMKTFWKITFPLSMPGLIAAFIFVFIPTIGEYVTPLLVGGPSGFMFGNAIQNAFLEGFNWQFGSAMGMFLIGAVALLIAVFGRYLNVRTVAR